MIKVNIIEFERGYGSKTIDSIEFDTKNQAEKFIKNYTKETQEQYPLVNGVVPDYYTVARLA